MDGLIWIAIIALLVLPILGWFFWLVFFVSLARTAMSEAEHQFRQVFPELQRTVSDVPPEGFGRLDAQRQAQIMNMLAQAQSQIGQWNELERKRNDVFVGNLMGMAASAGIDWTPP